MDWSISLSHARDAAKVPSMGQENQLIAHALDYDSIQRREPTGTAYALDRTADNARAAITRARREAEAASAVAHLVVNQAIFALKEHGCTVRQIAEELSLSKSEVARRLKFGHFEYEMAVAVTHKVIAAWGAATSQPA